MVYVPGKLFSVNQTTTENVPALFARNERVVCIFNTSFGPMAMVLVGAMIVASIETVWGGCIAPQGKQVRRYSYQPGEISLKQGDEMGRFYLGSTVVLVFPENQIDWEAIIEPEATLRLGNKIANLRE